MFTNTRYLEIRSFTEDMALDAIWLYAQEDYSNFQETKIAFLWLLRAMLMDGSIRLAKHGVILELPTEVLIQLFAQSIPAFEGESSKQNGMTGYFFSDLCPGGIVWQKPDGKMVWT